MGLKGAWKIQTVHVGVSGKRLLETVKPELRGAHTSILRFYEQKT